jgi:hypothetical protein
MMWIINLTGFEEVERVGQEEVERVNLELNGF